MKGLIFTYLMTYGGALVALYRPYWGLLIYICFSIVRPQQMWAFSLGGGGGYTRIVALAMLAGWVLNGFGDWRLGRAKGIVFALLGFLGWAFLSGFQARNSDLVAGYIENFLKIILPFLVGITTIDSLAKVKQLAWVIVLSEGYLAYELHLNYYRDPYKLLDPGMQGYGGMDNNCVAIGMVTCIGLAFFLGMHAKVWWHKGLAFLAMVLMAHVVMFSMSRGGMLTLIVVGALIFILIPKRPRHFLFLLVALAIWARLAGPSVQERLFSSFADKGERDASAQSRLDLWSAAWDTIQRYPIFGVGPYHWGQEVARYGFNPGKEAHSTWLQTGAEIGVPGVGFLIAFYLLTMARLWPWTRERTPVPDPWFHGFARMVIASLVGYIFAGLFVTLAGLEEPYYIVLVGAAALKLYQPAPATRAVRFAQPLLVPLPHAVGRRRGPPAGYPFRPGA